MKYFFSFIIFLLCSANCMQAAKLRKCTEQDIPMKERSVFIKNATNMITTYYSQLPLAIGDPMVQQAFIEQFMHADEIRYKPEFNLVTNDNAQYLKPDQYLLELDKAFSSMVDSKINFRVESVNVNQDEFYIPNLISCYLVADYRISLLVNDHVQYTRDCRAYCLFPKAAVSINVLLMQVEPIKDIIPYRKAVSQTALSQVNDIHVNETFQQEDIQATIFSWYEAKRVSCFIVFLDIVLLIGSCIYESIKAMRNEKKHRWNVFKSVFISVLKEIWIPYLFFGLFLIIILYLINYFCT